MLINNKQKDFIKDMLWDKIKQQENKEDGKENINTILDLAYFIDSGIYDSIKFKLNKLKN